MSRVTVRIVYFDDWEALYIDGKLAYENHGISLRDFLNVLQAHQATACMDAKIVVASNEDDMDITVKGGAYKTVDEYKSTRGLK